MAPSYKLRVMTRRASIRSGIARALRLAVLLLGLQGTGALHPLLDLVEHEEAACDDQCAGDARDGSCPPLCPDCTCAHGVRPAVPATSGVAAVETTQNHERASDAPILEPVLDPGVHRIFHPPRS